MPKNSAKPVQPKRNRFRPVIPVALAILAVFAALAYLQVRDNGQPGNRMLVKGHQSFWAGVNYPWLSYQDFGTGAWGHNGVSQETSYQEIDADFTNMAAQGVKIAKWRVFNDGRYSPDFDKNGYTTGLDDKFFADLDAALQIAEKHDVYLVLSLFSSGLWTTECERDGVQFGYGPSIMSDERKQRVLIQKALVPFLSHIGSNKRVLAYEIIAEPEWGVKELNPDSDYRQKVPLEKIRSFIKDSTAIIHTMTGAKATVESNRPSNMKSWQGLGLDYYTFSWYDWMEPWDPLDVPAASYKLDRPIVLGEFPSAGSQYYDLGSIYDIAYNQGYAGAFAWSYASQDQFSNWPAVRETYVSWVTDHWQDANVMAVGNAPDPESPVVPRPYVPNPPQLSALADTLNVNLDLQIRNGGTYILKYYLYKIGDNPQDNGQEDVVSLGDNGHLTASLDFSGIVPDQNYKLSLALFDPSYNLLKWIDGYAQLRVVDGTVMAPDLPQVANENPCYQGD